MKGERCETCRFYWNDSDEGAFDLCRRRAPDCNHPIGWPNTRPKYWCGEYEPKDELTRDVEPKDAEKIRMSAHLCCTHDFKIDDVTERATCKQCRFTVSKQTLVESGYLDYVEQVKKVEGP